MAEIQFPSTPAVREARFAGTWYPGDASALQRAIEDSLRRAGHVTVPGRPLALISPHSGHRFSYPVAAHAFALLRHLPIQRVVLLGPLHRLIPGSPLGDFMVPTEGAYDTPLGLVPVDRDFVSALARLITITPVHDDEEHSLEIELPFLQVTLDKFTLVPIMMGADVTQPGALERLESLAVALSDLAGDDTLFVCSTDLSHLRDYAAVVRTDRRTAELIEAFDLPQLGRALAEGEVMACGATGILVALHAAQTRGATGAKVLAYSNSGDITGDKRPGTYTVGYIAAAAY